MKSDLATHAAAPDFAAIKQRQQATWASGDFAVIGTTLQIVGELLAETANVCAGERVLDVAAGNGNATLAAAHRLADVTSTDYVPTLLDKGRERARAEGLSVHFQVADAEALPFPDGGFDVVLSTFGVMFAPDHHRAASEMLRVLRPGGRLGLANWTPEGFIGRLFKVIGAHVPPPAGLKSPALWGTKQHLTDLFGAGAAQVRCEKRVVQLPLPLAGALGAGFPRLLRADAQGLRRARHGRPAGARARHHRLARGHEHRRPRFAGGARRVPRSRDHQAGRGVAMKCMALSTLGSGPGRRRRGRTRHRPPFLPCSSRPRAKALQ